MAIPSVPQGQSFVNDPGFNQMIFSSPSGASTSGDGWFSSLFSGGATPGGAPFGGGSFGPQAQMMGMMAAPGVASNAGRGVGAAMGEDPEYNAGSGLGGAASGAMMGAAIGGPWGAAIGGGLGLLGGFE